jgi:hypothetical protein
MPYLLSQSSGLLRRMCPCPQCGCPSIGQVGVNRSVAQPAKASTRRYTRSLLDRSLRPAVEQFVTSIAPTLVATSDDAAPKRLTPIGRCRSRRNTCRCLCLPPTDALEANSHFRSVDDDRSSCQFEKEFFAAFSNNSHVMTVPGLESCAFAAPRLLSTENLADECRESTEVHESP